MVVSHPPPPPPPPPAEVSCVEVRHHVDDLLEPRYGKDPERLRKLGHTVTKHCLDDRWSPALRSCVAGTHSLDDGHHCLDQLSAEQRAAFDAAMDAAARTDPEPVVQGGMPPNCVRYKASVDRMMTCDKYPQATRDAMRDAFEMMWKQLQEIPDESKGAVDDGCKAGADAIDASLASMCP